MGEHSCDGHLRIIDHQVDGQAHALHRRSAEHSGAADLADRIIESKRAIAAPATWTASDIKGVTIDARNMFGKPAPFGEFKLEIDWIRVY